MRPRMAVFLVAMVIGSSLIATHVQAEVHFRTARAALQQGIAAIRSGNVEIAVPALEYAAKKGIFPAHYYLARIYSDNTTAITNHPRTFRLLHQFVDQHASTDPADYRRAPIVGRAMTRLARYLLSGVPEINVNPNLDKAVEIFYHAASHLNDEDAQFELAKLQLTGDGVRRNERLALHWLSVLSRKGHPGAQAFLADLIWRGKYTKRNPIRALILITLALENAPQEERVWIEDIHQNIFCGASNGTKRQVSGMVANWRKKFGREVDQQENDELLSFNVGPQRTCSDGEPVRRLAPLEEKRGSVPEVKFEYGGASGSFDRPQRKP